MTRPSFIPRLVASLLTVLVIACAAAMLSEGPATMRVHAQDAQPEESRYLGAQRCQDCHTEATKKRVDDGVTKFVALNESEIWNNHDKHAHAFKLIDPATSAVAKRMCDTLGIKDIHQAKQCLSCHSDWKHTEGAWEARPIDYVQGVACESCHGPSRDWDIPHTRPEWRKNTPAEKLAKGFVEVRNPVARAKQCLACHVGDPAQHKVVTHEMYAAGHPPLPGVELETFAAAMPPHWRPLIAKPNDFTFRAEFIAANPSASAGGKFHASRGALISAIAAMQASLALVGAQTEDPRKLPDFAAFDCYACHHDLKTPAWRQARRDVGVPGRPHPAIWPEALVEAALAAADAQPQPARDLRTALAAYHAAFDARPFGDAAKIAAARKALSAELDTLLAALEKASFDQAAAQRAYAALRSPSPAATIDFDAARQIAWTLKIVAKDLGRNLPAEFGADVHLALPAGQQGQITVDFPRRMKAMADFDPAKFRADLAALPE